MWNFTLNMSSKTRMVKMNKKKMAHAISLLCVLCAGFLVFILSATTVFNPGQIYDNDRLIIEEEDRYHAVNFNCSPISENVETDFSFAPFSGSKTIHIFEIDSEGSLIYSWNMIVNKGQFKVVLVNIEKQQVIEIMFEGTGNGKNEVNLPQGEYRIKFVGNKATAKGQIKIDILE